MIAASCATISSVLALAAGGETIQLRGRCPTIEISKFYPRQVTVDSTGSTIQGLVISGGNIRWKSGQIVATGGAFGRARAGYGVLITGQGVVLDGVTITQARKGLVLDRASGVKVINSRFFGLGEDGIIASASKGLIIRGNRFENTIARPSSCYYNGQLTYRVAKRKCAGVWADGTHADALQMRNGVSDALIEYNTVSGATQGLTQMDTAGDAPLQRVTIRHNKVMTSRYHPITLGNCIGCRIEHNQVRRESGSSKKAIIIGGQARRCGNVAPDDRVVEPPC